MMRVVTQFHFKFRTKRKTLIALVSILVFAKVKQSNIEVETKP